MTRLFSLVLAVAGLAAAAQTANAQYYYGYRYGAQYYNLNPYGYGYGYPGYYNGYIPGVNQTVISVSPYWRPLVVSTPVVTTPYGPNYYYSNYYGFRTTPFGFNYASSQASWVSGGLYNPLVYPAYYPGYYGAGPAVVPAAAVVPEPVVIAPRPRIYRGFIPVVNPLVNVGYAVPATDTAGGSFTPFGVYMPATGTYVNPFAGIR
jgi:hypothetical protein